MKKMPKKVSVAEEMRRNDCFSDLINGKLSGPFKKTEKVARVLKVTGILITVAFSVYGLIPKRDALPGLDNQIFEVVSD